MKYRCSDAICKNRGLRVQMPQEKEVEAIKVGFTPVIREMETKVRGKKRRCREGEEEEERLEERQQLRDREVSPGANRCRPSPPD